MTRKGPKDPVRTRKWPPRGNSQLAEGRPQLHLVEDPAGRILCVQRNIQSSIGAPTNPVPFV
jgi:hypothetical protein